MINKTFTSLLLNDTNMDLFYRIDDTFVANSNIYFTCPLNVLNSLLSESISIGSISSYKLYVRISDSISGSSINNINFEELINLNSTNIENNSIVINISNITNNISHDYLCDIMNFEEISKLYKNYKIIFRISSNSTIEENKNNILSSDIYHDLNILLNTAESGPYDVAISEIDLVSPLIFSLEESKEIYKKYMSLLGRERVRCFYPKNISNKIPLLFFQHGNGQFTVGYDLYLATIASYGYVCFSLDSNPDPAIGAAISFTQTIEHIFDKQNIINFGFSPSIMDFNKINIGGHSRGAVTAIGAYNFIRDKSNNNIIQDYFLEKNNFKTLISFAGAGTPLILNNSVIEIGYTGTPLYDPYHDLPIYHIKGTNDGDSQDTNHITFLGYSYDIRRNFHDLINIEVESYNHGSIACPPYYSDVFGMYGESKFLPNTNPRFSNTEKTLIYNNQYTKLIELCSELIYFLSINNFNSKKIKKIHYSGINLIDKKILKNKPSGIVKNYYQAYGDIKYLIHNYSGITSSFAGSTGFTYSTHITGTFGYAIDSGYIPDLSEPLYNLFETKRIPYAKTTAATPNDITDNDTFNGIINLYDKCLFLSIESNMNLGYTFMSGITLTENEYLCLSGSLKIIYPRSAGNTLPCAFDISLIDNLSNISTLSSKISDQYFEVPYQPYNDPIDGDEYVSISQPVRRNTIYFRAGDFYLQNPAINLNNINQILLSFGPDYGSTFCHIVLDEFIVLKEI
jgi:hypothetical protein